jgi:hypothetical protein
MSHKKIYSYENLDNFCDEYVKFIVENIDKNEQEYKKSFYNILEKTTGIKRCHGKYTSGKSKGERCHAYQSEGSKYCLNHITQDNESKELREFMNENKDLFKENPELLKEAVEQLKKLKLHPKTN